jgi:hypothetical protein
MNAYDKIKHYLQRGKTIPIDHETLSLFVDCVNEQADRIAELEKDLNRLLKSYGGMAAKIEEMGGAYQEPKEHIEDLYPLFSSYVDPKGNVYRIPFNSTTPQTKPLSDEEIEGYEYLIAKVFNASTQQKVVGLNRIIRAIEAKVRGEK